MLDKEGDEWELELAFDTDQEYIEAGVY